MNVYKIEVMVIDFDELGEIGVKEMIENTRYANHWIGPTVIEMDVRSVEWEDSHPLNYKNTKKDAFRNLFGEKS